jgi:CubicO group peptidase (beta-lactamase class C family)
MLHHRRTRAILLLITAALIGTASILAQAPTKDRLDAAEGYSVKMGGQTFIVVHDGQVIRESYTNGGSADRLQLLASATKGLVGMAAAIAADEGIIDLDKPVVEVLTEWKDDPQKSKVTYRHLLTMSSGFEELKDQLAWTDFLKAKVIYPAGSTFIYGPDPNLFGLAFQRKLGAEKVEDYMKRKLFDPLGMRVEWRGRFADGNPQLSGGAYVRANEWYKYGEFVRRTLDGTWNGPQLLSKALFDEVLKSSEPYAAYGFYWWLKRSVTDSVAAIVDKNNSNQFTMQIKPIIVDTLIPNDFVMCRGAYGQCLYVIPSRKLVVVRNAPATARTLFQDDEFLDSLLLGLAPPPDEPTVTITSSAVTTGKVGVPYSYSVKAQNNVGEKITYALTESPTGMTIDTATGLIEWSAPTEGSHQVSVRASITSGGKPISATQTYTLVIDQAKPPLTITFTSNPPLSGIEGKPYSYQVRAVASDSSKTVLYRLAMNVPAGMTLATGTNTITWPSPVRGSYPITVIARVQGDTLIERQTYTLVISPDTTTSVNDDGRLSAFRLYPNPATETFTIDVPSMFTTDALIEILDGRGQVERRIVVPSGGMQHAVNVSMLPAGIYHVRLISGENHHVVQMIIQR